jgi:nucleoside-diphosphate-sugar epimerase
MSLGTDAEVVVANVIAQTRNALKAAAKSSSVKSFVLMSSSSAALLPEANKTGVVVGQGSDFF